MASLTNVLNLLSSMKLRESNPRFEALRIAGWSKQQLEEQLNKCLTVSEIQTWNINNVDWVLDHAEYQFCLENLCTTVATALRMAAYKMQVLKISELKQTSPPYKNETGQSIIWSALDDITGAFMAFKTVVRSPVLNEPHDMSMIRVCLKRVLQFAITLGELLTSPCGESWFSYFESFLEQLEGFRFDDEYQDYRQIGNFTTSGVIAPAVETPASYLPIHPTAPYVYRSNIPYGPRILLNGPPDD